jgi:AhpD family alkylhydroperoxidase
MRSSLSLLLVCVLPLSALAKPAAKPAAPEPASYAEIRQAFGFLPGFLKAAPPELADTLWMDFKELSMQETALPAKIKDLISVAVASQIPCKYCLYADTKFAMMDGATDAELKNAVLMAALTRKWSTVLNGSLQDENEFKKELDGAFAYVKKQMAAGKAPPAVQVTDGASALKDIQSTFGMVPSFLKHYPVKALASAWLEMKQVQFNPQTALPGKYKELIGLAVAAQIPCKYCLYGHREAAKMNGATPDEIDEAIAIASDTRHWSAFLYGIQYDEKTWQREIDQAQKNMAKQMAAAAPAK